MKQLNKALSFLGTIGLIFTTFLTISCSSNKKPIEIKNYIIINQETISKNEGKYKIAAGEKIWYNEQDTDNIILGHDLINLPLLSEDNNDLTIFLIQGTIDFGFFVSPDMDCTIDTYSNSGDDKVEINCATNNVNACGVIMGSLEQPTQHDTLIYTKYFTLKPNVKFTINGGGTSGCCSWGVYFSITIGTNSLITISCSFLVTGYDVYGVDFKNSISSNSSQTINGFFALKSTSQATGVMFRGKILHASTQTIKGVFLIESDNQGFGITFYADTNEVNSEQIIDCVMSIKAQNKSRFVYFSYCHSKITIEGTYITTILSSTWQSDLINFAAMSNGDSDRIVNAYFSAFVAQSEPLSFEVTGNTNPRLNADDAHFFSNQKDCSEIFKKYSPDNAASQTPWPGKYYWNEAEVGPTYNGGGYVWGNNSIPDSTFKHKTITGTGQYSGISLEVVDTAKDDNATKFNNKLKSDLDEYYESEYYTQFGKNYIGEILSKI